jgi:hypothetical protein
MALTRSQSSLFTHLATEPQTILSQSQSPLFRLPAEIREQIFEYALTPYVPAPPPPPPKVNPLYPSTSAPRPRKKNPWNPVKEHYPTESQYSRPGQRAKVFHPMALLYTCKRAYTEAAHLPVLLARHNFYSPAESGPGDVSGPKEYFAQMTEEQRTLVRRCRVYGNVEWLLSGGLEGLVAEEAMRGVDSLNLVVRWCDWRGWKRNETLSLSAARPRSLHGADEEDEDEDFLMLERTPSPIIDPAEQEFDFMNRHDADGTWEDVDVPSTTYATVREAIQSATCQLPHLRTLRLTIEAPYVKADELQERVHEVLNEWDVKLCGKRAAEEEKTVKAREEEKFEWEAPMCAWSDFCAHCGGGVGDDKACEERKRRRAKALGPRVQGVTMLWS